MTGTVADLRAGERVVLEAVAADPEQRRRLAELGLRPGSVVALVQRAAGGACIVGVDGARIALDRRTAHLLTVGELP